MKSYECSTFIDKAISKTKDRSLDWKTCTSPLDIKPIPEERNSFPSFSGNTLLVDDSYYATFKNGTIVLLVFQAIKSAPSVPPDNCILSLRMQDDKNKYAIEIANSNDVLYSSSLIRLYNLISKESSSVSALINDFLNS